MRILRGLGSRRLACECVVGVYETYDGEVIAVLDARGLNCSNPVHQPDAAVELDTASATKPGTPRPKPTLGAGAA